jgi:TatD DNase family protein
VIAVGETGLDAYWSREHLDAQHASLREHARWAIETDKPLVLHNRDVRGSDEVSRDLVRLLREARDAHPLGARLRGVFHCFGGPPWLAAEVLDLGFHVGLGGTLTYKDGLALAAIADVPMERIVLETDAPYLSPLPHRGSRNEPARVRLVAERLALHRGLTLGDVAAQSTEAAERLFRLPPWPVAA